MTTPTKRQIQLHGRIFLETDIHLLTGLHIGGAAGALEIGGVDKPVIRNSITGQPYIPGSSLKGKMRSLMEKAYGAPQTFQVNRDVYVHMAESAKQYQDYPICRVFGTLPENKGFKISVPTCLVVRDAPLTEASEQHLRKLKTDLPYTEIKWEAAIDRVTSAATPRQIERVPAGAVFGPAQIVYSVYTEPNQPPTTEPDQTPAEAAALFLHVIEAMDYVQDDYLGGMGTRGNGRIKFCNMRLYVRPIEKGRYTETVAYDGDLGDVQTLDRDALSQWLQQTFPASAAE
jgi:CRISPR-associated protein Csm3